MHATPAAAITVDVHPVTPFTLYGGYAHWGINLITVAVTLGVLAICVLLHYEGLSQLSRRLPLLGVQRRRRVLHGIFGVLGIHVVEIWVFALATFGLVHLDSRFGQIRGIPSNSLLDHVYFSAVTFSTVGFGDVVPIGPLRFLVGLEALSGFVLITWSASFTYLEMDRYWRRDSTVQ